MVFFCPNCWRELAEQRRICVHCGREISVWDEKAFTEKLVSALSHPEPMTQTRAVYLLGEKKVIEAINALAELFTRTKNPFLQSEILEALGKIGDSSVDALLIGALRHPSFIVRAEAAKALGSFPPCDNVNRALERAIADPSSYVRETARQALKRLQGNGAATRK